MAEYGGKQRNQLSRAIGNCEARRKQLNNNNNDSLARIIQCASLKLPPLTIPQTETKEDFRARYPNSGFASNLATATNWGRNIGGKWAVTGSMAVALHTVVNPKIRDKVIPVDDLDIIDANPQASLLMADSEPMKSYYELPDNIAHNSGNYIGDKVQKTSIDILPAGERFGTLNNLKHIYGLPVVSITSLRDKYKLSSRDKDVDKIEVLDKM